MRGTRRGSRPLPEQSLPILLLPANDLGFRAIIRETELAARSAGGDRLAPLRNGGIVSKVLWRARSSGGTSRP
jgi:hypothetical protein